MILHVTVYYYSKLYNTSLPLVYLVDPIIYNSVTNIKFSSIGQSYVLRSRYHVEEEKGISYVSTRGALLSASTALYTKSGASWVRRVFRGSHLARKTGLITFKLRKPAFATGLVGISDAASALHAHRLSLKPRN